MLLSLLKYCFLLSKNDIKLHTFISSSLQISLGIGNYKSTCGSFMWWRHSALRQYKILLYFLLHITSYSMYFIQFLYNVLYYFFFCTSCTIQSWNIFYSPNMNFIYARFGSHMSIFVTHNWIYCQSLTISGMYIPYPG